MLLIEGSFKYAPSIINTLLATSDDAFRISQINRNFGFCQRYMQTTY
jgi:hypothetical protein